ncbi:hypothetical protein JCGZ_13553 [Jatropha curcas]|uniref:Uncharacterized protein n=1 Tax=Jatropha curcas TaxID=180498 RepID=A0A067KMT1_JATCU|nr:hypothetical protein JCGZ_13553 [Jatropha curcas]
MGQIFQTLQNGGIKLLFAVGLEGRSKQQQQGESGHLSNWTSGIILSSSPSSLQGFESTANIGGG